MMKFNTGKTNRLGNRSCNQDRFAIIEHDNSVLLIIADGMGGYKGGELAASMFILRMTEAFKKEKLPITNLEKFFSTAFEYAHLSVIEMGKQQAPAINPRTTGVVCLIQNGTAVWAHVGDSRCYLFRDNAVFSRTSDHSVVEDLISKGELTEKERLSHPKINQVTRCIGGNKKMAKISVSDKTDLKPGDTILLCTDGLWSGLTEESMIIFLKSKNSLPVILDKMSENAEQACYPSSDNITAVALRFISNEKTQAQSNENTTDKEVIEADMVMDEIQQALEKIEKVLK